MRTAIATGTYVNPGETFVNRHVAHLFGGNTCVICNRRKGDDPLARPVASRHNRGLAPLALVRDLWAYRSLQVPRGATRRALEAFLRAQQVRAVLCEFGTEAIAVAPVARALGLPVFTYFRGNDASKELRHPHQRAAYRRLMPQLAGVFAVSRFLLDHLARHGISHPESHVIPSGVDVRRFAPEPKRPHSFLAVGRLVEKKAPDLTVRAFCAAAKGVPDATLDIVGDGPLLAACRAEAARAGMAGQVRFHQSLPHDAVRALMARTEVFLQHSVTARGGDTEGLPTAIQEAMASGMVTLSTRHAGIPEAVIEGVTGHLVAERDEAGFARHIATLLRDGLPPGMAEAARQTALERFDNDRLLADLEAHMLRLSG